MKSMKMLLVLPICCMLVATPVSTIRAEAVTVDIKDNYDAGLLKEESDSKNVDYTQEGSAADAASSTSGTTPSSTAGSSASRAPTTAASTAANNASSTNTAAATASSEASTGTTITPTTASTTTDLPRTGDDDRIMYTFIAMLASFSVFLTLILAKGRIGKDA
ncbi:hypothetical protein [Butyrivibrio sp. JL13D10]|uniref:hypothetical protein n=1 Tax=Butyrivibrio sp. JL13D10 TaxID=3236815 RepID=UPI0038B42B3C